MLAYCYRDGVVQLNEDNATPEGAIELYRGPHRKVLRMVADTTEDRKIPGMEASTGLTEDFRILTDYLELVREKEGSMLTVNTLTMEDVEKEASSYGS